MEIPARPSHGAEADLVRSATLGNREAYGRLYDRHAPLIRAVCHDVTGNMEDAHDLCQEAFLRAYGQLKELRDPARFGGWLYGIARMLCRDWLRRTSRYRKRRKSLGSVDPAAPASESAHEYEGRLLGAIAELPERERLSLHLFYFEWESTLDAQAVMGLSRSGFYRVLARARSRLRRLLERSSESRS